MNKKIFLITGIVIIIISAVWYFMIAPQLSLRIPRDWKWESKYVGYNDWADSTGNFTQKLPTLYDRFMKVIDDTGYPDSISIIDSYIALDPTTKVKIWEYTLNATVDPKTGKHLNPAYQNDYILFPMNVEKKSYSIRYNYLKGVPVSFQKEEVIEGVNTYFFYYKGRGEYTESYAGTQDFPGVKVKEGQEICCSDDQFVLKLWVEPLTGEILKLSEECASGDYIYEIATGAKITAISRWGGETAGDDVFNRVKLINSKRTNLFLINSYVPLGLIFIGMLLLIAGIVTKKKT